MGKLKPLQIKQAIDNLDFLIAHTDASPDLISFSDGLVSRNKLFKATKTQQNDLEKYLQKLIDTFPTPQTDENRSLTILSNTLHVFLNLYPNKLLDKLNLAIPIERKRPALTYAKINHDDQSNTFYTDLQNKSIPVIHHDNKTGKYTDPGDAKAHQHGTEAARIFRSTQFQRFKSLLNSFFALFGIHVFESARYAEHDYLYTDIYANDLAYDQSINTSKKSSHYWIGHASNLITIPTPGNPLFVLTDPVEGDLAPLIYPRMTDEGSLIDGVGEKRLPKVDVVIISHNHRDHVSKATLARLLKQQPIMVVAKGDKKLFEDMKFTRVVETEWWEEVVIKDANQDELLKISAVPARHWSGRGPFDAHCSAFNGYVLSTKQLPDDGIYFAGDTALMGDEQINPILNKFNITTSIQPGGPDEMREDMESTHQCSADGILMHFKILAAKYRQEPQISMDDFLRKAAGLKTIFNHTSTFKLGNLRLRDTFYSMQRMAAAFAESEEWREQHLPAHEMNVYRKIDGIIKTMVFKDGEILGADHMPKLILESLTIPKIGERQILSNGRYHHSSMSPLKYRNLITNRRALIEYDKQTQEYLTTHGETFNVQELILKLLATYRKPWHARLTRTHLSDLDMHIKAIQTCTDNNALLKQLNLMDSAMKSRNQHGHLQSLVYYAKWIVVFSNQNDAPLKLSNYFACKNIKARVDAEIKDRGSRMIGFKRNEKQSLFKALSLRLKELPKSIERYQQAIKEWRETKKDGELSTEAILSSNRSILFKKEKTRSQIAIEVISQMEVKRKP